MCATLGSANVLECRCVNLPPVGTTYVYVDGFNLYYRALKGTECKWLDLEKLCEYLLPRDEVAKIRYFTAKIKDLPHNPGAQQRQAVFWRALDTLPRVKRHDGLFKIQPGWRGLHKEHVGFKPQSEIAWVRLPEEKGSDVNLASWMLLDGFRGRYTTAVVISNDSDLLEPIRMVQDELQLQVGVVNPERKGGADQLKGTFRRPLRPWILKASQFPDEITDGYGTFHRPAGW
jgi:hypothetical protein